MPDRPAVMSDHSPAEAAMPSGPSQGVAASARPLVRFLDRSTPPHLGTLIVIAGISALSMNIFLPSLPAMTEYFETDYRLMQLSVALYLAVNGVLQIFIGPISDRYGRRPVILWGCVIFLVATLGCIAAPTIESFLAFRMLQAVIVTGMVLSRAVVRDTVELDESASMIAWLTMGMSVVPMVGPVIGGVLDEAFGWQANFWLLFALGAIVTWLAWRDLGETARPSGLNLVQQFGEYPELLRARRFWGYALAAAFSSGAFFAYLGGAPFVGSDVFGLEPAVLGLYFGAPAVGYMLGNGISGRYSTRVGVNTMVLMGTVFSTAGLAVALILFQLGFGTAELFFGFMSFIGLGNGMTLPNATAGYLSVRPHLAGTASGLGGAIMISGGAALSAVAGALLTSESGAFPLLWIMVISSALGCAAILYVIRRDRELGSA